MEEEKKWFQKGSPHPIPEAVCEKHKTPSPQTVEEFTNIKINIARMEEKLDTILKEIIEMKKQKADKWTEKAIFGIYGGFATLLIGLVLYLLTHR